ncbi:MAG: prolyl oligopeptidase family serine peptidase [Streptosporangiales bacterium]|nr:prolyl oligopeptidase family serine peptidase [Streptosporangiales bacterium]
MPTPFHDLPDYMALPRVSELRLTPDGSRLIAVVAGLSPDRKSYANALWEIDPAGERPARRLTRSAEGEAAPEPLPDGSVLFLSKRADPTADKSAEPAEPRPALWQLPADGGEPRRVATRPGGIAGLAVARETGTVAFTAAALPGAEGADEDEKRRQARTEAGVSAILHEAYPIRYWDHDLGPAQLRLYAAAAPGEDGLGVAEDLTPDPGRALDEQSFQLTPDGRTVVTGWSRPLPGGDQIGEIVAIDAEGGQPRVLASGDDADYEEPVASPDGRHVVCVRSRRTTYDEPSDHTLWLTDLETGEGRDLLPGFDLWPGHPTWSPDSRTLYFIADAKGRRPIFRVGLDGGEPRRLTADHGAYQELNPSPDGTTLYALRGAVDSPAVPVALDLSATEPEPRPLPAPGTPVELPGRLTEVTTTGPDGVELRGWLVLPEEAGSERPAPLLLWIHGGPLGSWNDWSWRWNPWLMVARGYAVLLPDPALSTGYGLDFIRRGHGNWGEATHADLMAITDAAIARDDIDETRTAAMGGSFGGYMANWVAGHTDRFRCIVTHASLWALPQFAATTDMAVHWEREFGDSNRAPERYDLNSPHRHLGRIRTPMLVIHGDKDYRVPIGEGLRLWWDLTKNEVDAKFLYFPDENHWVLTPGNATVWYETVFAFLAQYVLGEDWARPELL